MMRVTLLGSGGSAGVPMIGGADGRGDWGECDPAEPRNIRTRASIAVDNGAGVLLVDTPPELRTKLISSGINRVDAILYTHAHADHVTGLDDIRLLNRIMQRPLEALATQKTLDELELRFGYAFRPWQPPGFFRPVLKPRLVAPGTTEHVAGMDIRLFDQDHGFVRTLGLRIGRFGYSTDVVELDDAAFEALAGIDTWLVGCFQRTPHTTHAWLDRVLSWIARLRPRRSVLTHMGVEMDFSALTAELPEGVEPGYDGQVIEIG
jgi:phosphoribosyl 1,2-cyclic phosphate phosphodiesterase